ncbi:hypothetical protein N7541_007291 [Penicillium brevicompactum]|uniref:Xylanolytic transcriptional activator regulatory domain-containing protein n=1 Tax=Penicillium brevicompactum TaxID=5074 RepID=A0A9W9QZV4_PENBR|nr:hypothetical protein N7541_007291 [Penicillium brevicompactum]
MDVIDSGAIKRIRQACANCRDATPHFHFPIAQDHAQVSPTLDTFSQPAPLPQAIYQENTNLPPPHVLSSVIDTYFLRVHNQPYSYFQETSFRQRLESDSLPRCLVLAVLSSAVRFSTHAFYAGQTRQASEKYARESWLSVLGDHLTMEDNLNVHVVQTVNLLAVVDYTAGRARSGWLKIGLAARISQDLHLMAEPDQWLSYSEQEEQRRAFWSIYLLDKLISCGRSRPLVILDEDCELQLPCDENTFRHGEWRKTSTIDQLLNWNSKLTESPSPFALVVLMASIFGRCTRYVHQSKKMEEIPPWDPKSEFSAINSSLLLLESYSKSSNWQLSDILHGSVQADATVDRQEIGHLIFAHTLFHLCHCLLNHPFLVRRWLKPYGAKAPASFSSRALQDGCDHAAQLMDLLQQANDHGCLVESSFYAYCIAVAGGIHSLATHFNQDRGRETNNVIYLQQSIDSLERLAKLWVHAGNIAASLREFHSISQPFATLLDPSHLMDELDFGSEEVMWSMIDYAILGADPSKKQISPKTGANLPSPTSWVLGAGMLGQDGYNPSGNILGGITPSMRLEEVEQFLNCSPRPTSPWEGVVSGTMAAILANFIVYPLDIVKTRLQVQVRQHRKETTDREKPTTAEGTPDEHANYDGLLAAVSQIIREEGISGLYSGLGSSILGTASMNFAYFYWSTAARSFQVSTFKRHGISDVNSITKELVLGAVGGALAQLCTNPIAVISTRQQTRKVNDHKRSMWETMLEIVQSEDGWTGLWRGFKVNLILVINPMITYGVYQWLREGLLALRKGKGLGSTDAFFLGALSKVLATIATHPLIVAKTMLQSKPPHCRIGRPFSGFTEVIRYIVRNEGLSRLYKGLAPQIIKGFLVQGLMMMLKER